MTDAGSQDIALPPGARIGILGSGQLGRMLALAAAPLGLRTHVYCPSTGPAFDVCVEGTTAKYEDRATLAEFAKTVDVVTYEFENIPVETVSFLSQFTKVRPGPRALEVSQDRLLEKTFMRDLGIAVADFHPVDSTDDLSQALEVFSGSGVLKTRRFGYDGKGQIMIRPGSTLTPLAALADLGNVPLILERLIPFEKEVSVIGVRSANGEIACFDLAENVHENHILKTSTVPADAPQEIAEEAKAVATKILTELDYIGAIGVEFFLLEQGAETRLLVNEIAPRVHNSGHYTMDACATSQFEQHIRAIVGWPLGNTARHSDVVMTNLLGTEIHNWFEHVSDQTAHFHDYAKREAREGRKMGHVNHLKGKA
ncbi:MAG: 5-(carboxyamino)imidazole ribonucleotide synthase [Pseudomonadota bacterium]